jgi:GNAT superfamily N-acetyltransferase
MEIPSPIGPNLNLVPIQADDQAVLFSLMDKIYRDAYRYVWGDQGDWYVNLIYNPETLQKELNRARSHYFFVESDAVKIGILKYDFPFSPREIQIPNSMKLHRLYLHPDFHGKGVAKRLVEHCEKISLENGLESIWLEVMSCQPQAKRFYEKMGFSHLLSYQLDFEMLLSEYRGIEIWRKVLGKNLQSAQSAFSAEI